ncbi:MAG: DUF3606 domain-containing protein [Bradyrhizobium sp.]
MRRPKVQPTRNKLDMTDNVQVRIVTKRLKLSEAELTEMVGRIGNSIAALSKEVAQQRSAKPASGVVASVTVTQTTAELVIPEESEAS